MYCTYIALQTNLSLEKEADESEGLKLGQKMHLISSLVDVENVILKSVFCEIRVSSLSVIISLVLNSLWETRKKWNSLSRNKETSRNFLAYIFIKFILKVKKKENKYFQKNSPYSWDTIFNPHLIFIVFLCINIFQIANFGIFSPPKAQF